LENKKHSLNNADKFQKWFAVQEGDATVMP
jgi:hypothetical protein